MFLLEVMLLNFCAFKFNMVGAAVPIFVHFVAKGHINTYSSPLASIREVRVVAGLLRLIGSNSEFLTLRLLTRGTRGARAIFRRILVFVTFPLDSRMMGRRMIGTARRGHRDGNILLHIIIIHDSSKSLSY